MEIKLAKLISGEILIGKYDRPGLAEAYLVQAVPQNNNSFNVLILPLFMPISKDAVNISADKIITMIDAPDNIKNEYTRLTTGLVMPSSAEANSILKQPILK